MNGNKIKTSRNVKTKLEKSQKQVSTNVTERFGNIQVLLIE